MVVRVSTGGFNQIPATEAVALLNEKTYGI